MQVTTFPGRWLLTTLTGFFHHTTSLHCMLASVPMVARLALQSKHVLHMPESCNNTCSVHVLSSLNAHGRVPSVVCLSNMRRGSCRREEGRFGELEASVCFTYCSIPVETAYMQGTRQLHSGRPITHTCTHSCTFMRDM